VVVLGESKAPRVWRGLIYIKDQNRPRPDVRFGSKADIAASPTNVRFTPNSGHTGLSAAGTDKRASGDL
jgi:hypothetical protein